MKPFWPSISEGCCCQSFWVLLCLCVHWPRLLPSLVLSFNPCWRIWKRGSQCDSFNVLPTVGKPCWLCSISVDFMCKSPFNFMPFPCEVGAMLTCHLQKPRLLAPRTNKTSVSGGVGLKPGQCEAGPRSLTSTLYLL